MNIVLHNTRSGKKEPFEPLHPDAVKLYVCGPTVYNLIHIGNGRSAVVFDVLVRLLRARYANVCFVRNITDIDDRINQTAQENGEPIAELAERFAACYVEDVKALGVQDPDVEPRATQHIDEIIDMIETLIERGNAYSAEGHVLFNVPSFEEYGALSHRTLEDMIDGARVEVAPYKRDPKDFVLWKPSSPELPGWESPWGRGRPGWHIECSAMIRKHLGDTIDIHGGGSDLVFPHHENELAQSTCVNRGEPFVRYWLHNGMLTLGGDKMSKSLGNIVSIRDLLAEHSGEVLRYALLLGQYRQSLTWDDRLIEQAKASLDSLYQALRDVPGRDAPGDNEETAAAYENARLDDYPAPVLEALCDDLNTPKALAAMHAIAADIHRTEDAEEARRLRTQLLAGGWLLGVLTTPVDAYFRGGVGADENAVSEADIERLIDERNAARGERDFARADEIRDELLAQGIELEDTRNGTRWRTL